MVGCLISSKMFFADACWHDACAGQISEETVWSHSFVIPCCDTFFSPVAEITAVGNDKTTTKKREKQIVICFVVHVSGLTITFTVRKVMVSPYIHVYILYICIHVCMFICIYIYMFLYVYICINVCTVCMDVCIGMCIYVLCVYMYIHIY